MSDKLQFSKLRKFSLFIKRYRQFSNKFCINKRFKIIRLIWDSIEWLNETIANQGGPVNLHFIKSPL